MNRRLTAAAVATLSVAGASAQQRPVYPYSLVPGGITSSGEWLVHRGDPVYSGSDLERSSAHPAQLRVAVARYVSFEKDGAVWWTDKRVTIPKGEPVLIIGEDAQARMVRSRCGNMLAYWTPKGRITSFLPPDTPLPPEIPPVGTPPIITWTPPDWRTPFELQPPSTLPPAPPAIPPAPALPPSSSPLPPGITGLPTFVPGGVPIPRAGSGGGSPEITGVVAPVPEPTTWGLSAFGIAILALVRNRFRSRSLSGVRAEACGH